MARTQDNIVSEIERQQARGLMFNFAIDDLISFLDFEHVAPFLKLKDSDADRTLWATSRETREPLQCARDYMEFAYDKAVGRRSLSAVRNIQHLHAWLWMAEAPPQILALCNSENVPGDHGVENLRKVARFLGLKELGGQAL